MDKHFGFTCYGENEEQGNETDAGNCLPDEYTDGFASIGKNGKKIYCITVIGQIEGHYILPSNIKTTKYEHMIPRLAAIEESNDINGLLLLLNTVGGDIEAGLAIAELIAGMSTPCVSLILGGGHSIGIPLAVAADKSLIVRSASVTVHPVRTNGVVIGVERTFDNLNKIRDKIIGFVADHSSVAKDDFRKMMLNTEEMTADIGTVLNGEQAVACGLIDRLGSLSDALSELEKMM